MSREDLHFRLRLPADLKADIEAHASANARSMTAEIVARLRSKSKPTLRDQIAMAALPSAMTLLMREGYEEGRSPENVTAGIAKVSYAMADAMLVAREGGDA